MCGSNIWLVSRLLHLLFRKVLLRFSGTVEYEVPQTDHGICCLDIAKGPVDEEKVVEKV